MDTIASPVPAPTPAIDKPAVTTLSQDLLDAAALGKRVMAAMKAGGPSAAAALLPEIIPAVEKDYRDVTAALPSIKAGYKTTEFWLIVLTVVGNGGYTLLTGKTVPVDVNAVLGGLVAIYTTARALIKKPA